MPVVHEPATEPFQCGSLDLLKLKKEGFAVASHQQRNAAESSNGTDANCSEGKVYYLMVEKMTPISTQAVAIQGKNALSIEFIYPHPPEP